MRKVMKYSMVHLSLILFLTLVLNPTAFAKKGEGEPFGWSKGKKKGWDGGSKPRGLTKKDVEKAEKEAKKKMKEAEKEAKRKAKEAEKAAKKAKKQAEKGAGDAEKAQEGQA